MAAVDELVIFISPDGGTVPWFHTEEGSLFSVRGPEGHGLKSGISHLDAPAGPVVDQRYFTGEQFMKIDGIFPEQIIGKREDSGVIQGDSPAVRIKVKGFYVINYRVCVLFFFKFQLIILKRFPFF